MRREPDKEAKIALLYSYVAACEKVDHFTVWPGEPSEVIVYRTLPGANGVKRGHVPVVQGNINDVLVYLRGEVG
jgi:hypothetical protein